MPHRHLQSRDLPWNRRLRALAMTQIAASFLLLAGAGMLLAARIALQSAPSGLQPAQVLALHVPVSFTRPQAETAAFCREVLRRVGEIPCVERVAIGTAVPWRDANAFGSGFQFTIDGYDKADTEEDPRAHVRAGARVEGPEASRSRSCLRYMTVPCGSRTSSIRRAPSISVRSDLPARIRGRRPP